MNPKLQLVRSNFIRLCEGLVTSDFTSPSPNSLKRVANLGVNGHKNATSIGTIDRESIQIFIPSRDGHKTSQSFLCYLV